MSLTAKDSWTQKHEGHFPAWSLYGEEEGISWAAAETACAGIAPFHFHSVMSNEADTLQKQTISMPETSIL